MKKGLVNGTEIHGTVWYYTSLYYIKVDLITERVKYILIDANINWIYESIFIGESTESVNSEQLYASYTVGWDR